MIIICGDSWGCGEWKQLTVEHRGITQYLEDSGHEVINVSVPGGSNLDTCVALQTTLGVLSKFNKLEPATTIIILFQTEWFRDIGALAHPVRVPYIKQPLSQDLIHIVISHWQYQLVSISKKYNVKIHLVGGASDTMWLSKFEEEYPGLSILCQSMTNLCVNNNDRIECPVYGIRYPESLVTVTKKICSSTTDLENIVEQLDLGEQRSNIFLKHPEYFWPDGVHANREAHYKLFEYIKEKLLL